MDINAKMTGRVRTVDARVGDAALANKAAARTEG